MEPTQRLSNPFRSEQPKLGGRSTVKCMDRVNESGVGFLYGIKALVVVGCFHKRLRNFQGQPQERSAYLSARADISFPALLEMRGKPFIRRHRLRRYHFPVFVH
jgi:hypothetical protein